MIFIFTYLSIQQPCNFSLHQYIIEIAGIFNEHITEIAGIFIDTNIKIW